MRRRMKHMGHRQRDILDTLRAGPMSTIELQAELGVLTRAPLARALRQLRDAGLVTCSGLPASGYRWTLAPLGEAELQIRERAGYAPGVARDARNSAALDAPYKRRHRATLAGG